MAAARTRIEHSVETLVGQRLHGTAPGDDLNDHDELRDDPVLVS